MNKNKKRLIVLSTCILSSSVLALPFLPKAGFLSNVTADSGYTCPLPDTYVELDTIISAAYAAGNTPRDNNYKFRGTVVRKEWDVAYIQRVNQVDHYAYALRITGVATFAEHIKVGNVVDFNGGQVYLYQGIPSFAITDNNKTFVRYTVNPTGYGPMVYHTVRDLKNEAYNSSYATIYKDDVETYTYASNRLVQIRNVIPYTYGNLPGDAESRKFYGLRDGYFGEIRVTSVSSVDLESYINEALSGNKTMHVTGLLQIYRVGSSMFPIINIIKDEDISIGNQIDDSIVTSIRTAHYYYNDYNTPRSFAIYNLQGYNDVPYVEFRDFFNNVSARYSYNHMVNQLSFSNHIFEYQSGFSSCLMVDTINDTIEVTYDPRNIVFEEMALIDGLEILADGSETQYVQINYDSSHAYLGGSLYKFDLGKYNLDIVEDKNHLAYVPLQAMNLIFSDSVGIPNRYNGKDLYCFDYTNGEQFWNEQTFESTVSREYADYSYSCLCLALEDIYGLCDVRGVSNEGADALLTRLQYKNGLKSTNLETYEESFIEFVGEWFFEGHSGAMLTNGRVDSDYLSPVNRDSSTNWHNIYLSGLYNNDRFEQMYYGEAVRINQYRSQSGKGPGVTFSGNTAILIFDEFVKQDDYDSADFLPYLNNFDYASFADFDTPLMFRKAFNEIDAHGDIDNVVIDLTNNGGGRNDALIFLEAYMTSDPVHTSYNRLADVTYDIHYKIDINYDGVIDENDTYEGKYNFYMMTSQLSFSCGNYLPATAYDKGYATLIGNTSGGGTCCVGYISTAYGDFLRSSSNHFLGYYSGGEFHNIENGVPVDYPLDSQYFYNDAYINNFVNSL